MSAIGNEGSVGGPSAGPVDAAKPLIASTIVPNPGRSRYGPSWPQPDTRAKTRRGVSLNRGPPPRPPLFKGPGGEVSMGAAELRGRRRRRGPHRGWARVLVGGRVPPAHTFPPR